MNFFLIHGSYGSPQENWLPWLKTELESLGHRVFVPHFPTPEEQSLESWMQVFEEHAKHLDEKSVFVGHSIGCAFILSILETLDHPIRAAFFVAGWLKQLHKPEFDRLNKTFLERSFDWTKIKTNCKEFHVMNSDSDPYVPWEKAEELAQSLGIDVTLVKGAGHFNADAGYTTFPLLFEKIKAL